MSWSSLGTAGTKNHKKPQKGAFLQASTQPPSHCPTPARSKSLTLSIDSLPCLCPPLLPTRAGTGGEHGRRPPHALLSLQEVPNRQYKLQVQEQALETRAHTAALTSLNWDQSSRDYMCPSPSHTQSHPSLPFLPISPGVKPEIESPKKFL